MSEAARSQKSGARYGLRAEMPRWSCERTRFSIDMRPAIPAYSTANSASRRSLMNMCPGACVIISGGFEAMATA